jgi:hypothetical protein
MPKIERNHTTRRELGGVDSVVSLVPLADSMEMRVIKLRGETFRRIKENIDELS